jgi:hypothetical protein
MSDNFFSLVRESVRAPDAIFIETSRGQRRSEIISASFTR